MSEKLKIFAQDLRVIKILIYQEIKTKGDTEEKTNLIQFLKKKQNRK